MIEPRRRKVSCRVDDNWQNEHTYSYKENLRVGFYSEVLDIVFNEFASKFSQESRIFLSFLGELNNRKMASDFKFNQNLIVNHFLLDAITLTHKCSLFINDTVIDATKPYKLLKQLADDNRTHTLPILLQIHFIVRRLPFRSK